MRGSRYDSIKPLLEIQEGIRSVTWTESFPTPTWKDFSTFRHNYRLHENLAVQQGRHIGVEVSLEPWLTVPDPIQIGVAVIARSTRYRNSQFPWRKILEAYPERVFVGLKQEHQDFQNNFGEITYRETKDLLELARVIAGASIVVSNQTCCWWISAGLGIKTLQETYCLDQNSVIDRPNLFYSRTVQEINALLDNL